MQQIVGLSLALFIGFLIGCTYRDRQAQKLEEEKRRKHFLSKERQLERTRRAEKPFKKS